MQAFVAATATTMNAEPEPEPAPEAGANDPEACAAQLKQRFPALFGGAPKPIKLRIQADIRERAPGAFGKAALSAFLRRHTGRTAYLIALTRASHRFDLDGKPVDEISAEHRQAAGDELARRRALSEAREAALQQQRRQRAELLRAFEGSTLTPANFCALKGVAVDELDALLDLARREADERGRFPATPARPGQRPDRRGRSDAAPRRRG
jgi:ProP effector